MQLKDALPSMLNLALKKYDYLSWNTHCSITEREAACILLALEAFDTERKLNPPTQPMFKATIIITDREELTLCTQDEPLTLGLALRLIFLQIGRVRKRYSESCLLTQILLEELCHIYYTDNERLVQDYVVNCFRHLEPNIRREDLYKT